MDRKVPSTFPGDEELVQARKGKSSDYPCLNAIFPGEELVQTMKGKNTGYPCLNAIFPGVSTLSELESANRKKSQPSEYDIGESSTGNPVTLTSDMATLTFFKKEFPALWRKQIVDDACLKAISPGVGTLSALLSSDQRKSTELQLRDSSIGFRLIPSSDLMAFSEDFPAKSQKEITIPANDDGRLRSTEFMVKLKMPKDELMDNAEIIDESDLPDLQCLKRVQDSFSVAELSQKRVKLSNLNYSCPYKLTEAPIPAVIPHRRSEFARRQRQQNSDKIRCLQKLIPSDQKMDTAAVLEEAYKYIKFLHAQISVLQSMPCNSNLTVRQNSSGNCSEFDGLWKLTRQQILQVLENSPVAQRMMYSQRRCVFSVEQLLLLKKNAERRIRLEHTRSKFS